MRNGAHDDIRRLLKEFGLTADETVSAYLIENKPKQQMRLRITLEDLTDYSEAPPKPLRVNVEGTIEP